MQYPTDLPFAELMEVIAMLRGSVPGDVPKALNDCWTVQGYAMSQTFPMPALTTATAHEAATQLETLVADHKAGHALPTIMPWGPILQAIIQMILLMLAGQKPQP